VTPAEPNKMLVKETEDSKLELKQQTRYRKGVGKLLHLMHWSRPDVLNPVRDLSRDMQVASKATMTGMHTAMNFIIATKDLGLKLSPRQELDENRGFKFRIEGDSNSDYANDISNRQSIIGYEIFLEGAPVAVKSAQQTMTTLSSAEGKLVSGTSCAQEMLFVMRILESMNLKVQKPMILWIDNKGAVDLANNWSIGGRARYIGVHHYFLRELKEQGILLTKWKSSGSMRADLFTKNLPGPAFRKHAAQFVG